MPSMDILDIISALAPILGGASASNQKQNNFEDITKQSAWNNKEQNQLARDKFAADAPGQRLSTANAASMTKNFTPTKIQWGGKGSGKSGQMPIYSGGAAGAARDPRSQDVANSVLDQELQAQLKGAGGGDSVMSPQPAVGSESLGSKVLGAGALGSASAAALKSLLDGNKSGGDLSKLFDLFRNRNTMHPDNNDNSGWEASYDPFNSNDPSNFGGSPTDPSGGTGTGPGMQGFYDWLNHQDTNTNGYDPNEFGYGNTGDQDPFGMEPSAEWGG